MSALIFCIGILQCLIIWALARCGLDLKARWRKEKDFARYEPSKGWPSIALIIPVTGEHPQMETALRSLLEQNYPSFKTYIVTSSKEDDAMPLIERLKEDYTGLTHVIAGKAEQCGQKNRNLLAGVEKAGTSAEIFVFCDSTHVASADFLRCLAGPIARGEAAFSTGYHEVEPKDDSPVTLAYALNVLFMRFLQGMSVFTQPWGGAMAMSRQAFEQYHVASLWERNVVDDCSLAWWLKKEGAHVRLCAAALLRTTASAHPLHVWRAWLERQILFLKFCLPGQWLALGPVAAMMIIPPIWCGISCLRGILGLGGGAAPLLAICWFCLLARIACSWRVFLKRKVNAARWLQAFFGACAMFAIAYASTLWTRSIVWRNAIYHVGKNGTVTGMERR